MFLIVTKCFHVAVRFQYHASFYCGKPELATGRLWFAGLDFFAILGCQITDWPKWHCSFNEKKLLLPRWLDLVRIAGLWTVIDHSFLGGNFCNIIFRPVLFWTWKSLARWSFAKFVFWTGLRLGNLLRRIVAIVFFEKLSFTWNYFLRRNRAL